MTAILVTASFLAAGAGAGVPHEKGSFVEELAAGAPHEKGSFPDEDAGAGVPKPNGSLVEEGAGAPQPPPEVLEPNKSVVLLPPAPDEDANGSFVPPHEDAVDVEVPNGSLLVLVAVLAPNGSLVLLVVPNGSLEFVVVLNGS